MILFKFYFSIQTIDFLANLWYFKANEEEDTYVQDLCCATSVHARLGLRTRTSCCSVGWRTDAVVGVPGSLGAQVPAQERVQMRVRAKDQARACIILQGFAWSFPPRGRSQEGWDLGGAFRRSAAARAGAPDSNCKAVGYRAGPCPVRDAIERRLQLISEGGAG